MDCLTTSTSVSYSLPSSYLVDYSAVVAIFCREGSMHARVTTTKVKVDRIDEAIQMFGDLQPLLSQRQGLKGATLLVNRNSGKGLAITFWETEADMLAVETSGVYQEALGRFADVFSAPPEREHYEVAIQM